MSVPAHDQRDFDFATACGLEIRPVIHPAGSDPVTTEAPLRATCEPGVLHASGEYDGLDSEEACRKICRCGSWCWPATTSLFER